MKTVLRYELKKIFGAMGGKIALLLYIVTVIIACCLATTGAMNYEVKWVNEQGQSEYGPKAVQKIRAAQNDWEGWLDEEKLNLVVQENLRINTTAEYQSDITQQREIAYGWKQGFSPIRELINRSCATAFRSYDYYRADGISVIEEETFYDNRTSLLKDWLYDKNEGAYDLYSEAEKQYIISRYEALETPLYFDYHVGWFQLLENASLLTILGALIVGYMVAGIFSNEFKWKTETVYFSTLFGRSSATAAKIKAGLLLVTILYWGAMLIYTVVTLGYLGFEGGGCMIQLRVWKSHYNITMWQAWALNLLGGYIGNIFMTVLTMLISAKTRSSVIAVTVPFVILFIPSCLLGIADWLDKAVYLMPASLLDFYQNMKTFNLITIFANVYRIPDVTILLYAVLTILLIPVIYREFKKKEIA